MKAKSRKSTLTRSGTEIASMISDELKVPTTSSGELTSAITARSEPAPGMFCTTIAGVPARKRARCRCTSRAYPSTPPPGGMPTMILMVLPANDAGSARTATGAAAARASNRKEPSPTDRRRADTALLRLGGLLAAGLRLARGGAPVPAAALVAAGEQGAEHGQQGDAAGQRGAPRPPTLGSCDCCHEARRRSRRIPHAGHPSADSLTDFGRM